MTSSLSPDFSTNATSNLIWTACLEMEVTSLGLSFRFVLSHSKKSGYWKSGSGKLATPIFSTRHWTFEPKSSLSPRYMAEK